LENGALARIVRGGEGVEHRAADGDRAGVAVRQRAQVAVERGRGRGARRLVAGLDEPDEPVEAGRTERHELVGAPRALLVGGRGGELLRGVPRAEGGCVGRRPRAADRDGQRHRPGRAPHPLPLACHCRSS
jgi:hypothetical protein